MAAKAKYITDRSVKQLYWGRFSNPYPNNQPTHLATHSATRKEHLQISDGHPIQLLGKTTKDIGGDFKVVKHSYHEGNNSQARDYSFTGNPHSSGAHMRCGQWAHAAYVSTSTFPAVTGSTEGTLQALGTKAIAYTIPTNPIAGLSVFLGELRQGIPRLCGTDFFRGRTNLARSAGSEYLNREFGWLPLISDVRKFSYAVSNSDEITKQYVRNSGRRIKRHFKFPLETSVDTFSYGAQKAVPTLTPTGFYSGTGNGVKSMVRSTKTERWFKGCFTYYLPPLDATGGNRKRNAALRNKLYGTRVTPETLWNLAPWSWAADWFANTGDILHNVSAFQSDGLVMPYGYMMETVTVSETYTLSNQPYASYAPTTYTQTFTTTVKQRREATPYGFGFDLSALSGRQKLILAALGLSKA